MFTLGRTRSSTAGLFFGGCLLSLGVAVYVGHITRNFDSLRFRSTTTQFDHVILARLERYTNALIHTKALFAVSPTITRGQFERYIEGLDVLRKYPGTQGIGYAQKVKRGQLPTFIRNVRRQGFPDYSVWPVKKKSTFVPILFIEPRNRFNLHTMGYDLLSSPNRADALRRAINSGQPVMSGKIAVGEAGGTPLGPGFMLTAPIFKRDMPTETSTERGLAIQGFVYSTFRAERFFKDLLREIPVSRRIGFTVYDGKQLNAGSELYQRTVPGARGAVFRDRINFVLGGRPWTVAYYAAPGFEARWDRLAPGIIFLLGVLISGLFSLVVEVAQSRALAERELNAKIREAVAARDEFMSIASHELKTPLTSLSLQLQMLRRDPQTLERSLDSSMRQLARVTQLIDELLDVTRIRAGKIRYRFEPVDLSALTSELVERYRPSAASAGSEMSVEASEPVVAEVDRFRIEQVLVNLITNAVKYGGGQPIHVSVSRDGGRFAVIRVQDFGMGIPKEKQELIFDRFERVTEGGAISGLGLGLYITHQIVEAHHGRIWVQSETGEGSTFIVELPFKKEPDSAEASNS